MPHHLSPQKIWNNWLIVEKKIEEETNWLKNVVATFLDKETSAPEGCRLCFIRKIAILIITGQVMAKEIKRDSTLKSLWLEKKQKNNRKKINHGKEWHQKIMEKIENHFLAQGYKVKREPDIYGGRADLVAYKTKNHLIFIEVGTTSFFKLWLNLEKTNNFTYLIVPDDEKIIEFIKK